MTVLATLLVGACVGAEVFAEPPRDEGSGVPAAKTAERVPVEMVVVGGALSVRQLSDTLGPQLRAAFVIDFATARRFEPQELFRARFDSQVDIHVWVDTSDARLARLYFANRNGTRFLVRTLELSGHMDEMDCEALAQAIEWSLRALTERSSEALTREQAQSLLGTDESPPRQLPAPSKATPPRTPVESPTWRRRQTGWLLEAASFYGASLHSSEIPILHGPGLRLGLDRLGVRYQLGGLVGVQYQLPQRHQDDRVALQLRTLAWRLDLRALDTGLTSGAGLGATIGAGIDTTWVVPEAIDREDFEAQATSVQHSSLLTGGIVGQVRLASTARLELRLSVEVDLTRVHYDVVGADGAEPFVARRRVHPVLTLGVEWF